MLPLLTPSLDVLQLSPIWPNNAGSGCNPTLKSSECVLHSEPSQFRGVLTLDQASPRRVANAIVQVDQR